MTIIVTIITIIVIIKMITMSVLIMIRIINKTARIGSKMIFWLKNDFLAPK